MDQKHTQTPLTDEEAEKVTGGYIDFDAFLDAHPDVQEWLNTPRPPQDESGWEFNWVCERGHFWAQWSPDDAPGLLCPICQNPMVKQPR